MPARGIPRARVTPLPALIAVALAASAVVAGWFPATADGPAAPVAGVAAAGATRTVAATDGSGEVSVVLDKLTPTVPRPGRTLRVSGRVVNGTETPVRNLSVSLHASTLPLGSRSQLADAANATDTLTRAGPVVPGTTRQLAGPLGKGESARFSISLSLDSLALPAFGVYPIAVDVTGIAGQEATPRTVGSVVTFLPWVPQGGGIRPTRLAILWPLVGTPARDADGVFGTDSFGTSLVPGGRLRVLLDSAASANVTWMLDPELFEAVSAMTDGYGVRSPDRGSTPTAGADSEGNPAGDPGDQTESPQPQPSDPAPDSVPGAYVAEARTWLSDARSTLADADVIALPYADPDLVALERRGLGEDLTLATTTGRLAVTEVLGRSVTGDVIWPPGGAMNQRTLEALRVAGARAIVLDGSVRPPAEELSYTPTGRTRVSTIGGPMDAALTDGSLSELFTLPASAPGSALLARQRILAETAMITAERPGDGRTVLAAPPRRWRPDPDLARAVLPALASAPWVRQVTLDEMLSEPSPDIPRRRLHYNSGARHNELPASHLLPVRTMRADLREFASILATRGGDATAPFDLAILRTESSAWRERVQAGQRLRERVRRQLDERRNGVYVAADRLVTLTSNRGRFPVTIANELGEPVDVELSLTPRQRTRMTVRSPSVPRIDGERQVTLEVPAEARANGVVLVDAQLRTPGGEPYGPPVPIAVRATDYGRIAYVITGGALIVLFSAAGFRIVRRARAARRRRVREHETVPASNADEKISG